MQREPSRQGSSINSKYDMSVGSRTKLLEESYTMLIGCRIRVKVDMRNALLFVEVKSPLEGN